MTSVAKNKKYWLMKSEPSNYSIEDLKKEKKTLWDGIRNYQARNFMMNDMKIGDEVLFYHSNAKPPEIVGLARVSGPAVPDPTAFDTDSGYFSPKSTKEKPIWHCVEISYKSKLKRTLPLDEIKLNPQLTSMLLVKKGQRLSIQPVTLKEYNAVCLMASIPKK